MKTVHSILDLTNLVYKLNNRVMKEINLSIESKEKEPKPDLIIDFIRHGKTAYGSALKKKVREIGQDPDTFKLMPIIDESIQDPREQIEGRITSEGEIGLREAIKTLSEKIDRENEIIAIVHGTRTRHEQSSDIIADEFKKYGIYVEKTKRHDNLVDVKGGGWYTFVDYIVNQQKKTEADLEAFWWEMYKNEETRADMKSKGFESLEEISERTDYLVKVLKRFVQRFDLEKTLRVIAVTSDINIEQIQQKETPLEKRDQIWVKNAEIYELKEWRDEDDSSKEMN